jgi:uncharacterized cupin superfamily protein
MSAAPPARPAAGTFSFDPSSLELEPSPLDPSQVVEGDPQVSERVLWSSADGRRHRGVWEHTPGISTDVEVDEVFVVVSGRATIEVDGGPTLEVGPGDVGVLEAGARTTWRIHETLRKVFHVELDDGGDGDDSVEDG